MGMGNMHMGQTSGSSSSADANNMNSKIDMTMASFLTKGFAYRPVVFEKLYARNKREAFGIFVLILTTTFVYKLILFVSWSLEVHWFKVWHLERKESNSSYDYDRDYNNNNDDDYNYDYDDLNSTFSDLEPLGARGFPKLPSLMHEIFVPTWESIIQDLIRIILTFASTLLIYILMLTTMTYVVPYLFGVVTGLSLCEVFFNKCKLSLLKQWELEKQLSRRRNRRRCAGVENGTCPAIRMKKVKTGGSRSSSITIKTENERSDVAPETKDLKGKEFVDFTEEVTRSKCCCDGDDDEEERGRRGTGASITEITNSQSQTDKMDPNLSPQVRV